MRHKIHLKDEGNHFLFFQGSLRVISAVSVHNVISCIFLVCNIKLVLQRDQCKFRTFLKIVFLLLGTAIKLN